MKLFKTLALVAGLFTATFAMNATTVNAATVYNYNNGLYYGNICQTPAGWQVVPWQLVGGSCWSPAWGMWGYIANY